IGASRIGVFAFREEGAQRIFVPVRVTSTASATPQAASRGVLLAVRPSFDADVVKWRWSAAPQGTCSRFASWQDATTAGVDAGQSVDIALRGISGRACVEVSAKAHGKDDWSTLKFSVEIPAL